MDHSTAKAAMASTFTDFEDAMQYYAAEKGNVQFIITRNRKNYAKGTITVMDAEEFVNLHTITVEKPEV